MTTRLTRSLILAIHDEQLAEHGGKPGLRDDQALDAALDTPQTLPLPEQAARAALGLVRLRPFVDGNIRTGCVALELFLALNGLALPASDVEATLTLLHLSNGELDDAGFIAWVGAHAAQAVRSS